MTDEEKALLESYQKEVEQCWQLAQLLDAMDPDVPKAFTGTPSERIRRQIEKLAKLRGIDL